MKLQCLFFSFFIAFSFLNAQVIEEKVEEEEQEAATPTPAAKTNTISQKVAPKNATHGKIGGRFGFYKGQEWLVPPVYDELSKEYCDFIVAKKDKKYGVIDRLNNEVFPFEYDAFRRPLLDWKTKEYANYYLVEKEELKGILDLKGNVLIPIKYKYLQKIGQDYYCYGDEEEGYGIMKNDGGIVIDQKYEAPLNLAKEGVLKTTKNGKIGFIDFQEKIIVPFEWDKIEYRGSVYIVQKNEKWGIMTTDLELVIEPEYDYIERRFNKIFKVTLDGKLGAINSNYKEIIPTKYTYLKLFHSRYFEAGLDDDVFGVKGVIDTFGNQVLGFEYTKFNRAGGDIIFAQKSTYPLLYGVYNKKGVQIAPAIFYAFGGLTDDLSYVMLKPFPEGKKAVINENGQVITPYIYDRITAERNRNDKEKFIITAERDGFVGTLNAKGIENNDFKSVVNERKEARIQEEKKEENILNKLVGEWYGMTTISGEEYLTKLQFLNSTGGIRTIYYLEKGKECSVDQYFKPVLLSDGKTFFTQFQSGYIEVKCSNPPSVFNANNMALFGKEILGLKGSFGEFTISKYSKREAASTKKEDYETLRKIKQLKPIEADLKAKVESKPGGLRYPEFVISPETGNVQIINYVSPEDFGAIELKKDGYIFKPTRWAKDSNFHLSGILRNIQYIDENGKEKTGDLDICFFATSQNPYFFREMLK